jgi:hypothetical protein
MWYCLYYICTLGYVWTLLHLVTVSDFNKLYNWNWIFDVAFTQNSFQANRKWTALPHGVQKCCDAVFISVLFYYLVFSVPLKMALLAHQNCCDDTKAFYKVYFIMYFSFRSWVAAWPRCCVTTCTAWKYKVGTSGLVPTFRAKPASVLRYWVTNSNTVIHLQASKPFYNSVLFNDAAPKSSFQCTQHLTRAIKIKAGMGLRSLNLPRKFSSQLTHTS